MHPECRKMYHFASKFWQFLENVPGVTPQTPIEAGLKLLAHQGLWESSPKSTVFHLNFKKEFQWNKCIQNAGKCTISHLDLENFPGVAPRTPFGEGHKLLLKHIRAFANFHPKKHNFSSRIYKKKKNFSGKMHSECRKMHHFASRFGKISRGETPNPLWNGTQVVSISGLLGIFSQRAVFSSRFLKTLSVEQMHSECRISHLDLENFPGVIPQTPIEAGLKLLAHQGPWEFSPKKHKELSWSWGGSWTFLLMGRVMNFSDFQWGGSWTSTMPTFDFSRPPGWCK